MLTGLNPTGKGAALLLAPSPAAAAVQAFWLELPNATVEGDVMRLAGGTTFLGDIDLPDCMYVRADYVGLWAELQHLFATGLSKIVVSGNPGIGKSWFGLFVAHSLLTRSKPPTIVWESRRSCLRFFIQGRAVLEGSLDDFKAELSKSDNWYLVDEAVSPGPVHVAARTLVFSSPSRENYKNFLDAVAATIRYLPVWSWEEIDMCRQLLYANDPVRTLKTVNDAYLRWGGIPRFVLEKVADVSQQRELAKAIARSKLDFLLSAVGSIDSAPEASHRVLHIVTSAPYVETSIAFGSDYITARVTELLIARQRKELFTFVALERDPTFATLRGQCFEVLAHEKLAEGGTFQARVLTSAKGSEAASLVLQQRQIRRFSGTEPADLGNLLAFSPGYYCRPLASTFPVLDALILPNVLLQMTVSTTHAVNEPKLAEILDTLQLSGTAELLFVVPPDKFGEFKVYNFKTPGLQERVVQKVVCVPFDVVVQIRLRLDWLHCTLAAQDLQAVAAGE